MSGTLVLDSEGLSRLIFRHPDLTEWLVAAEEEDIRVVVSSVTLVEARNPKTAKARFDYAVSRVNVVPVSEAIARNASGLLAEASLRGHKYALDAIVAATALAASRPVTVLTSDTEDLKMFCGPAVSVEAI